MKKRTNLINFILFAAVLFSSLPLLYHGIEGHWGQDLGFHINRIEGIYLELSRGIFPVRMQSFWMDGHGYPVSIYYGDIFLYFPALLRLVGVPVVAAYKIFLFAINVATVLIAYYCFSGMAADMVLGALGAFVYATSNYRLLDLYIRGAVGEYTALAFLPLVVYGVFLIYGWCESHVAENGDDTKPFPKTEAIICLTTGMTGILLSHMMTLEITGICLIMVCVFSIKKTFTPQVLMTYITSAVMTVLLTLYFTVPFADYFLTETVRINQVVGNARQIQESGTRLYEFFDFFMIPFSNLDPSISNDRMLTTPGMVLMGTLIAAVAVVLSKRGSKKATILTAVSLILLFVSSDIFPWNWLGKSGAIGDLLAQVQFPWRYMGIGTVVLTILLLTLLSGGTHAILSAKNDNENIGFGFQYKKVAALIIAVGAAMCVWFAGVYGRYAELETFADTADLDTYDMGFIEYLRPDAVREEFIHEIRVADGKAKVNELFRDGTSMDIFVETEDGATIELPVVNYKYYHIFDDSGKEYAITDGKNDEINFDVDAGFDGVIYLRYEVPVLWHIAEIISLMTAAFAVVMLIRRIKQVRE